MSGAPNPQATPQAPAFGDTRILAIVCYGLFIAAFTNGLTAIVGVVLAHIKRGEVRGTIWESHFTNLIRVFWTGIAFWVVFCAAAMFGFFGIWRMAATDDFSPPILVLPVLGLALIVYVIWYLYRTVRGLLLALENKAYA